MSMPKKFPGFLVIALAVSAIFASCSGSDVGVGTVSSPTPDTGASEVRILSWAPPSSYTDSSLLDPESELSEYHIYVNETGVFSGTDDPSAVVAAVDSAGSAVTTFNLANIPSVSSPGATYYVSMRSVTQAGVSSDFSPVVSFSL